MAYNKAKAEQEWVLWKKAEEKTLRDKGMDEDTIQRLYEYDWESFKAQRNFIRWQHQDESYIQELESKDNELPVYKVEQLLDSIENQRLYDVLSKAEKLTLQILLYKVQGLTSKEISRKTGLSVTAIDLRVFKLKKKIKKFF